MNLQLFKEYRDRRLEKQLAFDMYCYGQCAEYKLIRRKYNPMRFVFGNIKTQRINPVNIFIRSKKGNIV